MNTNGTNIECSIMKHMLGEDRTLTILLREREHASDSFQLGRPFKQQYTDLIDEYGYVSLVSESIKEQFQTTLYEYVYIKTLPELLGACTETQR